MSDEKIAHKVFHPEPARGTHRLDPARCAEGIMQGYTMIQCSRRAAVREEDYGWCKQHAPSAERTKREESDRAMRARWATDAWQRKEAELHRAVADAALSGGGVEAACRAYREHEAAKP